MARFRDYFDRPRSRGDVKKMPRPRLPPIWVLDCPEGQPANSRSSSEPALHLGAKGPPRSRTPSGPGDLEVQRRLEKNWDATHAVVFSKDNSIF